MADHGGLDEPLTSRELEVLQHLAAGRSNQAIAAELIVAVGTVFTAEALALLEEAGARVVAFRRAYWTDESARARQA